MRIWFWLGLAMLCGAARPAAAETVVEVWRSPYGAVKAVALNPTDGSCWAATGNGVTHVSADGVVASRTDQRQDQDQHADQTHGYLEPDARSRQVAEQDHLRDNPDDEGAAGRQRQPPGPPAAPDEAVEHAEREQPDDHQEDQPGDEVVTEGAALQHAEWHADVVHGILHQPDPSRSRAQRLNRHDNEEPPGARRALVTYPAIALGPSALWILHLALLR